MTTRLSAVDRSFNSILRTFGAFFHNVIAQHNQTNDGSPLEQISMGSFLFNLRKMVTFLLDPDVLLYDDIQLPDVATIGGVFESEDDFNVSILNGEFSVHLTWWDANNVTWELEFDYNQRMRSLRVFNVVLAKFRMSITDIIVKDQFEEHFRRFPQIWDTVDENLSTATQAVIGDVQRRIRQGILFMDDSDVESPPSLPRKKITQRKKSPIKKKITQRKKSPIKKKITQRKKSPIKKKITQRKKSPIKKKGTTKK